MSNLKPDRQKYKDFDEQLAERSSTENVESVLKLFLAMLFVIPLLIVFMWVLLGGILGSGRSVLGVLFFLMLAVFTAYQAFKGLVRREMSLPFRKGFSRHNTGGGRTRVTGQEAVALGAVNALLSVIFLVIVIQILAASLHR